MKCEMAGCSKKATHKVYFDKVYASIGEHEEGASFAGNVCYEHYLEWEKGDVPIYNEEGYSNEEDGWRPFCWDGCGCVHYENSRGEQRIVKCDLHQKNPTAFGGISLTLRDTGKGGE